VPLSVTALWLSYSIVVNVTPCGVTLNISFNNVDRERPVGYPGCDEIYLFSHPLHRLDLRLELFNSLSQLSGLVMKFLSTVHERDRRYQYYYGHGRHNVLLMTSILCSSWAFSGSRFMRSGPASDEGRAALQMRPPPAPITRFLPLRDILHLVDPLDGDIEFRGQYRPYLVDPERHAAEHDLSMLRPDSFL